ncbi:ribokinase [Catenibacillus scindens]|uniref:Ribokinase n=1 Tax=Catenibacillus scindens TaxID=673271 RepID=A0A7W8M5D5_9FIRM|nr:ribokinase [Catenibacillus scindens]MBB5264955.1 ribokinase [Catenibacillus scindens]
MKKIAVIGSINMDMTVQTQRHPKVGETVAGHHLSYIPGGKGANQAVAAARLGGDVTMFGCVGDDIFSGRLIDNLAKNNVDTRHIRSVSKTSCGIAMITVAQKDNTIIVIAGANQYVSREYISQEKENILQADIILLQNEIPFETVAYAADMAWKHGKTVIYNPAPFLPVPQNFMNKITYVTPNEHEAALLYGEDQSIEQMLEKSKGKAIITLGDQGAAAWINARSVFIPPRPANVTDTTGAGDTFNGALACGLSQGQTLEEALRFANTAASLSTEKMGAQTGMPDRAAVARWMPAHAPKI